jgi:DNA-binding MarR family transcriptional regulator
MRDERYEVLGQLLELVVLLNHDMTESLARDGLTTSRARVLWELYQRGPMVQRDLAEALRVSPRTVTGLVDGLAGTGFVTREPHPTDRRATLITFTEHGASTVEALEREQHAFVQILFGDLPERTFECFAAGLRHVLDRLREQGLSIEITAEMP